VGNGLNTPSRGKVGHYSSRQRLVNAACISAVEASFT
jgi:hypothetical protein